MSIEGEFGDLMSRVAFGGYLFAMLVAAIMVVYLLLKIVSRDPTDD